MKKQYGVKILVIVIAVFLVVIFSGNSTSTQRSTPVYKIDFADGSSFYAEDFSRIDVKGSGGEGCLEFIAMTNYVSDSGKTTKEGEIMLHCGIYTFSPPYIEDRY